MRNCGNDRGAFAVPGIVKIAVALGVIGVLGYDGFVTVATHLKAENDAQNIAYAASSAWSNEEGAQRSASVAYGGAMSYLAGDEGDACQAEIGRLAKQQAPREIPKGCDYLCVGATNQSAVCGSHGAFSVDPDGTVHLVVRREAKTLIFGHLSFLHSMLVAYETGDANATS